jgi:hypothetical protein
MFKFIEALFLIAITGKSHCDFVTSLYSGMLFSKGKGKNTKTFYSMDECLRFSGK